MFNTKLTQCSSREESQIPAINRWSYQAILYPPFTVPWESEGEGKDSQGTFFPRAQQAGKSTKIRVRKVGNIPWTPREEVRERRGFYQDTSTATMSKLLWSGGWVLQGADIKMRSDMQEIY